MVTIKPSSHVISTFPRASNSKDKTGYCSKGSLRKHFRKKHETLEMPDCFCFLFYYRIRLSFVRQNRLLLEGQSEKTFSSQTREAGDAGLAETNPAVMTAGNVQSVIIFIYNLVRHCHQLQSRSTSARFPASPCTCRADV